MSSPEILAPVGDWHMLRAAVHNGADAVYIGMPGFNARGRAPTLDSSELQSMIEFAHLYGIKVFLAFNVLVFEREIQDVVQLLQDVLPLHPDALIVQDIGLIRLIRAIAPTQEIHASTQMTVTSGEAITLTHDLDIRRYVLGREVSTDEMAKIRAGTTKELEVFVHGALCVSYSGQCLTSESMGGRSANRGQCAQSCRLPYELVADGKTVDLGERRYLVSPKDLCSLDDVAILKEIGINSFKIEGRLKSPAYVASTVQSYKKLSMGELASGELTPIKNRLETVYSRGFFNGWMNGVNHQELVDGRYSSHHGLAVGGVTGRTAEGLLVESGVPFMPGDGVVFVDFLNQKEFGSAIFHATPQTHNGSWLLSFAWDFDLSVVPLGASVFINSSPVVDAEFHRTLTDKSLFRKIPVSLTIAGRVGEPLHVSAVDGDGNTVTAQSTEPLQAAKKAPLTREIATLELGALSGTVFALADSTFTVEGACFIHNRELKEIRRELTRLLTTLRRTRPTIELRDSREFLASIEAPSLTAEVASKAPHLNVLVREISQLEDLAELPIDTIFLDFEFGKEYAEAAATVRSYGYQVGITTTRILKPNETSHLKVIERVAPDEVLVRNLGALQYLKNSGLTLVGDFGLNISNSLSADWFLHKGLTRLSPSLDLNKEQLVDLLTQVKAPVWEVSIHQYIAAFHMEHCVFAAFLSKGTSYRDCGRPCEKYRVELRDPKGVLHPLKADAECRNTMFNGTPQSAATLVPELLALGVKTFRIEGLFESSQALAVKVRAYSEILSGVSHPENISSMLGVTEKVGITEGQLYNIRGYRDRKKEFVDLSELPLTSDPGLQAITETR
jgi:putative protease